MQNERRNMRKTLLLNSLAILFATFFIADLSAQPDSSRNDKSPPIPKDTLPANHVLDELPKGLEAFPVSPENNTPNDEKIALGRRLFFDPILSADNTVSCASCHQPKFAFASPDAKAVGINGKIGRRNVPSILNRGFGTTFLWDGRAASLEEQALIPISSPDELGHSVEEALKALRADESYVAQFKSAFPMSGEETISAKQLGQAIASFERTLISGNSQVDRFRASDYEALDRSARQGMWIFESRGGCWQCHSGPNLSDETFHNTGVSFGQMNRDEGRYEFSKQDKDKFKFKTPSLRDVEKTAPYMHDGSMETLREVVEFYNKGGSREDPGLSDKLKPLNLTEEEIGFLVDFLRAYSGDTKINVKN